MSAGGRVRIVVSLLILAVCLALSASAAVEDINDIRRRAEQGDANAQVHLGAMYENGRGVIKDYAEAARWYRKAAERGNADGQSGLGWLYENGRGVPNDYAEAVRWYRKAADQGNVFGQLSLGMMYENGRRVRKDPSVALYWYSKAAERGDEDAQTATQRLKAAGVVPPSHETNDIESSAAKPQPETGPDKHLLRRLVSAKVVDVQLMPIPNMDTDSSAKMTRQLQHFFETMYRVLPPNAPHKIPAEADLVILVTAGRRPLNPNFWQCYVLGFVGYPECRGISDDALQLAAGSIAVFDGSSVRSNPSNSAPFLVVTADDKGTESLFGAQQHFKQLYSKASTIVIADGCDGSESNPVLNCVSMHGDGSYMYSRLLNKVSSEPMLPKAVGVSPAPILPKKTSHTETIDINVIVNGPEDMLRQLDPRSFQLFRVSDGNKLLRFKDPDELFRQLAKRRDDHINAVKKFSNRTVTRSTTATGQTSLHDTEGNAAYGSWTGVVSEKDNEAEKHNRAIVGPWTEDISARYQPTLDWLQNATFRAGKHSGWVLFEMPKSWKVHEEFVLRIPIGENTFEFRFAYTNGQQDPPDIPLKNVE